MSATAYKFIDRRKAAPSNGYSFGNNSLIKAATQTADRENVPQLDRDFHRNITGLGRRTLMSLSRALFWNFPVIQGAVLEQANLAASSFIPQYYGRNKAWGDKAEAWLYEWHKVMDIEGPPFDYDVFIQHLVISALVDGDMGIILTETPTGYPQIQCIPSHLIGSRWMIDRIVTGGEYDGSSIVDGIIVNDYMRPLAARIYRDDLFTQSSEFTDVSFRDMILNYWPMVRGQKRGLPALVSLIFDSQDIKETRAVEMLAAKMNAGIFLVENNEGGEVDRAKLIMSPATYSEDGHTKTILPVEKAQKGVRYFRAGSDSKLEAHISDRPTGNQREFIAEILRSAFSGMEWSYDFGLDPSNVGGAPFRVIVAKINATIGKKQKMIKKVCARVDGWALSKAINNGELDPDPDWSMWDYQVPARITADAKYDSEIDVNEVRANLKTKKEACGNRGEYYEDVQAQRQIEREAVLAEAKVHHDKYKDDGLTFDQAIIFVESPTPNGNLPVDPAASKRDGAGTDSGSKPYGNPNAT
jgi:capsid protein